MKRPGEPLSSPERQGPKSAELKYLFHTRPRPRAVLEVAILVAWLLTIIWRR